MLNNQISGILEAAKKNGWVFEPEAKKIMRLAGIGVPEFIFAASAREAEYFPRRYGFPVAAKVVSPKIMHKSDAGGVVVGIDNEPRLHATFERFSRMDGFLGMHVEKMVSGRELIVGAKVDYQFGPVILFGTGGIGVELYRDTAIRMAPLEERDVVSMVKSIKAHSLLEGYRGEPPVVMDELVRTMIAFSDLVMDIYPFIDSIDLNPLFCSSEGCVAGDARIVLKK